jgi:pimeloyl-ACP methyl ester carboxylesterase
MTLDKSRVGVGCLTRGAVGAYLRGQRQTVGRLAQSCHSGDEATPVARRPPPRHVQPGTRLLRTSMSERKPLMATFGLVHGGMHGAWCWDKLRPELALLGHDSIAVDLPCEDVAAGSESYCEVAVSAFRRAPEELIVVGHSLGGLTIPLIAQSRPIAHVVFLCGLIPVPGLSSVDSRSRYPDMLLSTGHSRIEDAAGWHTRTREQAISAFYHDVDEPVREWALPRLRRQSSLPSCEITPIQSMPNVPRSYIYATGDRCINPEWTRREVPNLLGVEPLPIAGGHCPFLSRPAELARLVVGAALPAS